VRRGRSSCGDLRSFAGEAPHHRKRRQTANVLQSLLANHGLIVDQSRVTDTHFAFRASAERRTSAKRPARKPRNVRWSFAWSSLAISSAPYRQLVPCRSVWQVGEGARSALGYFPEVTSAGWCKYVHNRQCQLPGSAAVITRPAAVICWSGRTGGHCYFPTLIFADAFKVSSAI
jgi:hypothetical protein